jgi:hypothetical protein
LVDEIEMSFVDRMLEEMEHAPGGPLSLYALLDAAREAGVVSKLDNVPETSDCLYEGEKARELAAYAPYIVELSADSPLLGELTTGAIGKSYCVFLTTKASFEDIRKHLRHFLMVTTDDGGEVYFRFYDPRVLRVFLPTCTPEEVRQFFGPIRSFWIEAREPGTMTRFWLAEGGALREDKRSLEAWGAASAT